MNRIVIPFFALFVMSAGCAAMPAEMVEIDDSIALERFTEGDFYLELWGARDVASMDGIGDIEILYFDGEEEVVLILGEDTTADEILRFEERVDPALRADLAEFATAYDPDPEDLEQGLARAAHDRLQGTGGSL